MSCEGSASMADSSSLRRHRDFQRLWGGQTVSLLGTEATQLALPLAAILTLHASPFEVAVLTAVEVVPLILFGLPAGVWVDRLRRRPLLIVYVPTLVGRARIAESNAKLEGSRSAMHVVGPGIAGLLVGALKAPVAIAVDAASFLVSAVSLLLVGTKEAAPPPRADRRTMRADLG